MFTLKPMDFSVLSVFPTSHVFITISLNDGYLIMDNASETIRFVQFTHLLKVLWMYSFVKKKLFF